MRPALSSSLAATLWLAAGAASAQAPAPDPLAGAAPPVATPPTVGAAPRNEAVRQGREVMAACRTDVRAWCSQVQPGGGRILQCFRQNHDKLTPACVATLKAMRGQGAPPSAG